MIAIGINFAAYLTAYMLRTSESRSNRLCVKIQSATIATTVYIFMRPSTMASRRRVAAQPRRRRQPSMSSLTVSIVALRHGVDARVSERGTCCTGLINFKKTYQMQNILYIRYYVCRSTAEFGILQLNASYLDI